MTWSSLPTEDRLEAIQSAWKSLTARREKATAGSIAAEIGGITRNAIIGYYTRKPEELRAYPLQGGGFGKPAAPRQPKEAPKPRAKPAERIRSTVSLWPHAPVKWKRIPVKVDTLEPLMLHLVQLDDRTCKWPIGDPKQAGFGFCGHETDNGSWCAHHARRVFVAGEMREAAE